MDEMDITEAEAILDEVVRGLVAAGMDDVEAISELACSLVKANRPEVLVPYGKMALEQEIQEAMKNFSGI